MIENQLVYDKIWVEAGKPVCKLFVDDNALRFEGNWPKTLKKIKKLVK